MKRANLLWLFLLFFSKSFCQELIGKTKKEVETFVTANGGTIFKDPNNYCEGYNFPCTTLICDFPKGLKDGSDISWIMVYFNGTKCFQYQATYASPAKRAALIAKFNNPANGFTRIGKGFLLWHSEKDKLDVRMSMMALSSAPGTNGQPTGKFSLGITTTDKSYYPTTP